MQNLLNIYNHKECLELLPEHDKIGKACPWHFHQVPERYNHISEVSLDNSEQSNTNFKRDEEKEKTFVLRHAKIFGASPWLLKPLTLCCVGFVFCKCKKGKEFKHSEYNQLILKKMFLSFTSEFSPARQQHLELAQGLHVSDRSFQPLRCKHTKQLLL